VSIFIGSNAGETIEPGFVSPTVAVIGNPKTPGAGVDIILAGSGDDRVAGGGGNDIAFLGTGNDLYTWNSGDGNDVVDGGSGTDTLAFNGSAGAETIKLSTGILGTTRVSSSADNGGVTLTGVEHIVVSAGAGDDVVDASGLPAGHASIEIFGGLGNDLLIGSAGDDFFNGGDGNDTAQMGAGNDTFVWNPGDDNDVVEGQAGTDTLLFNGANIAEEINVQSNGQRVLFTRNIATVSMDLNGVERIDFNALGGADVVRVHDLSGTDVKQVNVNLAATPGGSAGDGALDQVIVDGTSANDTLQFTGSGATASVLGLAATTTVLNAETSDQLIVNGLTGNDVLSASVAQAAAPALVFEGGDGQDTAVVEGSSGADTFAIAANGTRAHVDAGNLHLDVGTTESVVVHGGAGDDQFSAVGNLAALTSLTLDGGAGNDTILGGNGADLLIGGDGNDFIDGNQGNDVAQMGAGDDTFQWDPGDGSDIVEGGPGSDTMLFNGANIAENMELSANGQRALFTRNIGTITMDLNDVERIDVTARGGADNIAVHDLTGTDVTEVNVDLAGIPGGSTGDGAADQVALDATSGADSVAVSGAAGAASIAGLPADVKLSGAEAALDTLQVNLGGGNDIFDASGLAADVVHLTVVGGAGADLMIGSQGSDTFVWNPGDGNDSIEGQAGVDNLLFNGANIGESVDISANGSRALFTRDIAGITMDLNDVERIDFNALGGVDKVVVNDLSGTDVTEVNVSLAAAGGGGDGSADVVTVNATSGDDVAVISGGAGGLSVLGLAARLNVTGAEGALDRLQVNAGTGDDVIDASGVAAGAIKLVLDGGEGNDVLLGSAGDDVLIGGPGDDILIGNGGNDTFIAGPGADVVIQGFAAGAGSQDVIDLRGLAGAQDFASLMAHASDVDGNAVLDLGGEHVTLENVSVASLHSDDFLLG
jgi:Ca2+-binding RTX toxin-like protein